MLHNEGALEVSDVFVMRYLEEEAVSTLSPQDFRAGLILTVLLIHLKLFFLTAQRQMMTGPLDSQSQTLYWGEVQ